MIPFLACALAVQRPESIAMTPGLRLELAIVAEPSGDAESRTFRDPSAQEFRLRFVNGGSAPIDVALKGYWDNHRVVVRDKEGRVPPLTPLGASYRRIFEEGYGAPLRVEPHRSVVPGGGAQEERLTLSPGRFYFLAPGERYSATVEYCEREGSPVRTVSNTAEFVARALPGPIRAVDRPVPTAPSGVRLELAPIPSEARSSRNPANYRLSFVNDGDQPIRLHWGAFWSNHRVRLLDAQGQEPPLSPKGQLYRDALVKNYGNRDHDVTRTIFPGETLVETAWIDVAELYGMQPGAYRLTVEYYEQLGDPMRIASNSVALTEPKPTGDQDFL